MKLYEYAIWCLAKDEDDCEPDIHRQRSPNLIMAEDDEDAKRRALAATEVEHAEEATRLVVEVRPFLRAV